MAFDQLPIPGPYKGIVDNLPRPSKPANAWDDLLNFMPYKGRLITRPRLNAFADTPDGAILRNAITFSDILGNLHTLALTTANAYFVTSGPTFNLLTLPGGLANLTGTSLPYGYAMINSRVYFSNGSVQGLYADGESSIKDSTHPGAWRYAGVLANHLVTCNTTEPEPGVVGSESFANRIRWSASGDANDWTSFTAGFTDLLEVPDQITGFATLGRAGYIFRSNGITLMTPTGVGTSPFQFDQVTNAPQGVGNKYPYSLATFGGLSAFVASNDIYGFDGSTFTPFGGEAKKKIFADIADATGDQVTGWIVPRLGTPFDFLSYWLSIPGVNVTWVYSYDDQAWSRFTSSSGRLTTIATITV